MVPHQDQLEPSLANLKCKPQNRSIFCDMGQLGIFPGGLVTAYGSVTTMSIIHDEVALRRIREYIINNPAKAANKQRKP